MKVLVINPGATSTKVAVFEEERELLKKSIVHTAQELEGFDRVIDQADFRQRAVLEAVAEGGFRLEDFDAVCGRGGLYRPIPSGTYAVSDRVMQDVEQAPEAIGIGSSRVLQFNRENTGVDTFFNMGVTGADVRDNMTSYYKMVSYGKTPKVLLWSIDPWVFYGSEDAFDSRADADLYNEFLTKVLNVPTDYEEPDKVELWKALADPAYFQGNVDYYIKNRGQTTVTDDDGNTIEFNPVQVDPYDQTTTIKRSDGSVLYDVAFRTQTEDQIRTLAAEACMSFNSVHMEGFDEMSTTQVQAFESFMDYAREQGTTVILVLSPWHPYLYGYLITEPELHKGFFQVENWLREYCAQNNVPLYGSYDPECIDGLEETDFFDGLHCAGTGIARFFPGIPRALQQLETGTLPDPLAVHPRTSLESADPDVVETLNGETAETAQEG